MCPKSWKTKKQEAIYDLKTEIDIVATPEVVFGVLTDWNAYPEWSSFILAIKGSTEVGDRLRVRLQPPGSRSWTFKPTLLAFEPNREFRWRGRVPGYTGEHFFILQAKEDGSTQVTHGEHFSGRLVPLLNPPDMPARTGFLNFNTALKARAEAVNSVQKRV